MDEVIPMRTPKTERKEINIMFGEKLRKERERNKLTREAFAEKIDVSARFLADIEGGFTGVSLSTLKDICITLGCSSDKLLGIGTNESSDEARLALKCSIDLISKKTVKIIKRILPELENALSETE